MKRIKDLIIELDYWIYINIADDIVRVKEGRKEYQPLVKKMSQLTTDKDQIPKLVLVALKNESKLPVLLQKTQYWLFVCHFIDIKNRLIFNAIKFLRQN